MMTLNENYYLIESFLRKDRGILKDYSDSRDLERFQRCRYRRRPSRWGKCKTWRSPSSLQIYQKYIYMWNNSYRTPTECWQKTSDLPKGKKLPTYLGRTKEKRKTRDKSIGTGPAPVGRSCEGGKVSTH